MDAKKLASKALLGFVLVSIGFALGKEVTLHSLRASGADQVDPAAPATATSVSPATTAPAPAQEQVLVYYLHATIRCSSCNWIERTAREVLQENFAEEMQRGRVVWRTASFQREEELARKYDVASSTIVLVKLQGGKEARFERLDKVWQLVGDAQGFSSYVSEAVRSFLGPGGSGKEGPP